MIKKLVFNPRPGYYFYVPDRWTLTQHFVGDTVTPAPGDQVIVWNDGHHKAQAEMKLSALSLGWVFVKRTQEPGGQIYKIV